MRFFFSVVFLCLSGRIFVSCSDESGEIGTRDSGAISSDDWFKEKKLVKLLLSQQDGQRLGRPVKNHSDSVEVEFGINLIQVLRVNEDTGQLITNIWTHFRWCDPSLSWNQSVIGVDIVRIPAEEIWTPDVALFNYADARMRQHRSTLAVVNSTGCIDWIPTGIFKSACSIDTFSFPFDEQLCFMTFRSLSMGVSQLTLKFVDGRESMSLDSYVTNPEWEITQNTAIRSIKVGKRGIKTSFYDLTFTLRLKRRSVFHRYLLVLPSVLLSLTAGVLFMLPPESPAKIQIGIFIFQGFFLLLNLLKNSTPPAGTRSPIIGLYYGISMIATTVVMFACGYLVEIHFRADQKAPMSKRLRNIVIKKLALWLFIPIPARTPMEVQRQQRRLASQQAAAIGHNRPRANTVTRNEVVFAPHLPSSNSAPISLSKRSIQTVITMKGVRKMVSTATTSTEIRQRLSSWGKSLLQPNEPERSRSRTKKCGTLLNDLIELRKTFQRVTEKQSAREYTDLVKLEWLIAIMVFDRIFLFVYISYIIASLYILLPQER